MVKVHHPFYPEHYRHIDNIKRRESRYEIKQVFIFNRIFKNNSADYQNERQNYSGQPKEPNYWINLQVHIFEAVAAFFPAVIDALAADQPGERITAVFIRFADIKRDCLSTSSGNISGRK